jgi:uncharacterized protein (TIGR03083 family)
VEHWDAIAAERRGLADQLDTLTPQQWATPSLCAAWTVRDVAAHLGMAHKISMPRSLVTLIGARGSFDRANRVLTAREAVRPTGDLVADLRRFAESRFAPPGMGSVAPLTDVLVHGQDVRIPRRLADHRPVEPWGVALTFLVTPLARRGFVSRPLTAVQWVASDLDWTHGSGPQVQGPAAALALAMMGRDARLDSLTGPGATIAADWVMKRPGEHLRTAGS